MDESKSLDFKKPARCKPVPPHTEETYRAYLEDPYARCAWVIPVRGRLPWSECSAGFVQLEDADGTAKQATPLRFRDDVTLHLELAWTEDSVREFWTFLVGLRSAGNVGPLGLSFHAAPAASSHFTPAAADSGNRVRMLARSGSTAPTGDQPTQSVSSTVFQSVDHFKVYHDATQAGRVRNLLEAWKYRYRDQEGVLQKMRFLSSATFVLLDEASQPVMTY